MKESKLQKLIDECSEIEQSNYLGGKFNVDLREAQKELDAFMRKKCEECQGTGSIFIKMGAGWIKTHCNVCGE